MAVRAPAFFESKVPEAEKVRDSPGTRPDRVPALMEAMVVPSYTRPWAEEPLMDSALGVMAPVADCRVTE